MGDEAQGGLTALQARARILGERPAVPDVQAAPLSKPLIDWTVEASWGVWARPGLDLKNRALVTCVTLAVLNRLDKLETHLSGAFRQGWRTEELSEALLQITVYAGVAAGTDAFAALPRALAAMEPDVADAGNGGMEPRPDSKPDREPLTPHEARIRVVGDKAVGPDLGPPSLYAPLAEWASKAVWETWARPGLDLKYRSLVVCIATAVLNRLDLLQVHLVGALRLGWKAEELSEALLQMTVYAGVAAGTDAFAMLAKAVTQFGQQAESTGPARG